MCPTLGPLRCRRRFRRSARCRAVRRRDHGHGLSGSRRATSYGARGGIVWAVGRHIVGYAARSEGFDNCDQGPEGMHVAELEIGIFKSGRKAYGLDDIAIVPQPADPRSRGCRHQLGDRRIPVRAPTDGLGHGRGGQSVHGHRDWASGRPGCAQSRGLWTRYEDPTPLFDEIRELPDREGDRPHAADVLPNRSSWTWSPSGSRR